MTFTTVDLFHNLPLRSGSAPEVRNGLRVRHANSLVENSSVTVAEGLAAGLNTAKIALIYVTAQLLVRRCGWRALFPRAIHLFLITISLVMTIFVIGGETISPNAEHRLASAQEAVETRFAAEETRLENEAAARRTQIRHSYEAEQTLLAETLGARLAELQDGLDRERDNVVGAEFYGPRYQDFERNIELERATFASRTDEIRTREEAALASVATDLAERLDALRRERDAALADLNLGSVFDVEEAQNRYLLRLLEIARYVVPEEVEVEIVLLTVVLSIMLSLGVEISPILILGYVFRGLGRPDDSVIAMVGVEQRGLDPVSITPANYAKAPLRSGVKVRTR